MAAARARRRRRRGRVWVPVLLIALLLGGYATADAVDVVPGVFTTAPEPAAAAPFPTADTLAPPVVDPVPGPDEAAPQPAPAAVADAIDRLLAAPAVGSGAGVLVVDVVTGAELGAVDADATHIPASTTKMLTAAAAVAAAGPDATFTTRVVQTAPSEIVLVGGGDLTLAAGAGDPVAVVGRAGLADLAAATAQRLTAEGTTTVSVGLDTSYYTGPDMAPRWDDIDLAAGDAMHMAPLAVDIGRVEGRRARALDPGGEAAAAFVTALADAGITVQGEVAAALAPDGATELAAVESAPLADLAAYMLQESENILAEGIGRMVAHAVGEQPGFAGSGIAVRTALADAGITVEGLELADTSGLSSTNRISPRTLVETLLALAEQPALGAVARGLPVAGLEGTLADRLLEEPAAGLVAAKTGTLRGVVSLSGFATTADGRLLAFAVLADDVPTGGTLAAREAVDAFAVTLASCGC